MSMSFQKFLSVLLFPVGVLVCIALLIISSILWVPYLIAALIDLLLWKVFDKDIREGVNSFEEFIFACYGFAALMVFLPLSAFEEELY